jgi:hypothetical protein
LIENREYGHWDVTLTTWHPLSAKKLAITSLTSGGHSVGIVSSRTQTMEFSFFSGNGRGQMGELVDRVKCRYGTDHA